MVKRLFKIDGMHCTACAVNIDGELEDTEGVLQATTNYAKQETTVEFDPGQLNEDKIINIIDKAGYEASLI